MLFTKQPIFLSLVFTLLLSNLGVIKANGHDSEEDEDGDSSEEVYQFELEDDVEEVNAEEFQQPEDQDGSSVTNELGEKLEVDNAPVEETKSQPIQINIHPVTPDEFSCKGVPNGNQVNPNPTDCLSFYTCAGEAAYKIMCPQIPQQTYYDPTQRTCGAVAEHFCLEFAEQVDSTTHPSVETSSGKADLTEDEEQDAMRNFGGEIFDEETSGRVEL